MSFGESNISKYGGVSEFGGRLRSTSGDEAATEASFDRKGSLGFIGGTGILALLVAETVLLRIRRFRDDDEDEKQGNDDVTGTCKMLAIFASVGKYRRAREISLEKEKG